MTSFSSRRKDSGAKASRVVVPNILLLNKHIYRVIVFCTLSIDLVYF